MNPAIGFTAIWQGSQSQITAAIAAEQRALAHFPDIEQYTVQAGGTVLHLWGRGSIKESTNLLPDGSILALIGSPLRNVSWQTIDENLKTENRFRDFRLPWDGRVLLLYISADGNEWALWNDWLGSIPVFHAESPRNRIASTLEPVVVSANGYTSNDFFLPGIVSLLSHGNFISDWTIFKDMKVAPPDSVSEWDENGFHSQACDTIQVTDERWETGWSELVDEMHQLSRNAILDVLKTQQNWTVPLSSGLDSRLIAAVGADAGTNLHTYTWGPSTTRDVIHSRKIAQALGLPWKQIDLGVNYLADEVKLWADLFGSSMHFHGMYQIPFLKALRAEPAGKIISGYIGECLAGYDARFLTEFHKPEQRTYYTHPDAYIFWNTQALRQLFKIPIEAALEELADEIERQKNIVAGQWYQRLRYLTLWGRQRHFTYFQSMLSDYWFGAATPYVNRDYARFALSLPRAALDDRRLQIDMMCRYYANVMSIPGTYAPEPAILTGSTIIKRRLARVLPGQIIRWLLPEYSATKNIKTDVVCMQLDGEKSTWPISETESILSEWVNFAEIKKTRQSVIIKGDIQSVRKLQSVQALAYCLMKRD